LFRRVKREAKRIAHLPDLLEVFGRNRDFLADEFVDMVLDRLGVQISARIAEKHASERTDLDRERFHPVADLGGLLVLGQILLNDSILSSSLFLADLRFSCSSRFSAVRTARR
jgi:hypothetical protein